MVTKFDTTEVHDAVHHRDFDELTFARTLTLMKRSQDTDHKVQAGTGVAYLGARNERRAIHETGCRHRSAHRLRNIFIGLKVGVGTRAAEALDRREDDRGVDLVDLLPGKPEPIEHAGPEILHHDVA